MIPKRCQISPERIIHIVFREKRHPNHTEVDEQGCDDIEIRERKRESIDIRLVAAGLILETKEVETDGHANENVIDPQSVYINQTSDGQQEIGEYRQAIGGKSPRSRSHLMPAACRYGSSARFYTATMDSSQEEQPHDHG